MLLAFVKALGWILVRVPEWMLRGLAAVAGWLLYRLPGRRRDRALSNLYHAFPDRDRTWRDQVLKDSCRQLMEMALFVLASPHMSEAELRRRFTLAGEMEASWDKEAGPPAGPVVALVPHTNLFEGLALLPMLNKKPYRVGTVYRPLNQPMVEAWVLQTRQRFGMQLISRKKGLQLTNSLLGSGAVVAILSDQHAGKTGVLTTFFGRVCSTSDLPGMLGAHHNANVYAVWAQGNGFWRSVIHCEKLGRAPANPVELCVRSNQWMEKALSENDAFCRQWLWLHDRWRSQSQPSERFHLQQRRDGLQAEMALRGWDALPKKTHAWIRLPNWLGDVVMALPLLRALRRGRPDMHFTVLALPHFVPLLEKLGVADTCLPLPPKKKRGYWKAIRRWSAVYPHVQVLFTNSTRGDIEARLINAQQRFGIVRKGKPRPLLTDSWKLPEDLDEAAIHQTQLWNRFLQNFGLEEAPDLTPLHFDSPYADARVAWQMLAQQGSCSVGPVAADTTVTIGLICGTENSPEKRWPVERWRELIASLLERGGCRCVLFGTRSDAAITAQVTAGFAAEHVIDRAGKTDLLRYAHELRACDLLVSNDTGGMHLANALGLPTIVVFGPTNPVRTGPVFAAPTRLLQPPGCPPQGGAAIEGVSVAMVMAAATELLGERLRAQ